MKKYCKPSCISHENIQGIVPLAAAAAAIGLSAEAIASVGGAALVGAAAGLAIGEKDFCPVNRRSIQEQMVY